MANSTLLKKSLKSFNAKGYGTALWLGASQLHVIQYPREGDQLAVIYANRLAEKRNASLAYVQATHPNANLYDLLGFYTIFRQAEALPEWLIVSFIYDDLREHDAHDAVLSELNELTAADFSPPDSGFKNLMRLRKWLLDNESNRWPIQKNSMTHTPQALLENTLVGFLERHWPAYAYRGRLLAVINSVFRKQLQEVTFLLSDLKTIGTGLMGKPRLRPETRTQRVPKIPEYLKEWNWLALEALARLAREDGVKILVYKAPHRPGEAVFYHDREAYDAFAARLSRFCQEQGLYYQDFERLVPEQYWGTMAGQLHDPFHFRAEAHQMLADAVDQFIARHTEKLPDAV